MSDPLLQTMNSSRESRHTPHVGHETVTMEIAALIAGGRLHPLFQPILDVARSSIVAHEGLIRGPSGSALHLPSALFPAAIAAGLTNELEFAAASVLFTAYAHSRNTGLLFVNFSARSITQLGSDRGRREFQDSLLRCQMPARSLVIEITEHERVEDHQILAHAIQFLRSLGVSIATSAMESTPTAGKCRPSRPCFSWRRISAAG
jgi:EAL domain-containing protein (putative c-di-GMP-specific phosphodiesterase class I)